MSDGIEALLLDRNRIGRAAANIDPRMMERVGNTAAARAYREDKLACVAELGVERIDLAEERLTITIRQRTLLAACGLAVDGDHDGRWSIDSAVQRVRKGHELRLVIPSDAPAEPAKPRDEKLVALLAEAFEARKLVLGSPDKSFNRIAIETGRCRVRLSRLFGLSHLAPEFVVSILEGCQPASLTASKLLAIHLPIDWAEQRRALAIA